MNSRNGIGPLAMIAFCNSRVNGVDASFSSGKAEIAIVLF